MKPIIIAGAGFAALSAILALRKYGYQDAITLIAPQPLLFYYPSLIWVPAGLRTEAALSVPLTKFFARMQVDYQQAQVTGLEPAASVVHTDQGNFNYSSLIIASGARFLKKLPGIEHCFTPCEGYAPTQAYSQRLHQMQGGTLAFGFASNPHEPAAMRGGPIFEFLFGIDSLLRQQKRRDQFKLVFFSPAARPGQRLGDKAVDRLLGEMQKRNIDTFLGHKLVRMEADKIITEGGELHSDLTLFMPGLTGPAWASNSQLPLSPGGFFQADEYCRVVGTDSIFVAGDSGSFPGPDWMPKQAHMADLQAEAAVHNLLAQRQGQPPTQQFKTELVCIVDTLKSGILVYRSPQRSYLLPGGIALHWLKRLFEWYYLRTYR
jgi:sulfide:quinone oxidoreductase